MDIGKALIARAQPYFLAARAQAFIDFEAQKGCSPIIFRTPVNLEPPYSPLAYSLQGPDHNHNSAIITLLPDPPTNLIRLKVLISPHHALDWTRAELFLKVLKTSEHMLGFEIVGNNENIEIRFLVHANDAEMLRTILKSQYIDCELSLISDDKLMTAPGDSCPSSKFYDYYPDPPYSHLFTQPHELKVSPLDIILQALANISAPNVGFYQMLFQGTHPEHDWHRNINILNDFEYAIKLMSGMPMSAKFPYQAPSGELRGMAQDDQSKAHNDKPIFSAAMRIGVIGTPDCDDFLPGLSSFASLFQHGGRPFRYVTQKEYLEAKTPDQIRSMFLTPHIYRAGFLLNSSELAGMVHIPPGEYIKEIPEQIKPLKVPPLKNKDLLNGIPIGIANYLGIETAVCIPSNIRFHSTHLVARHGMGKSTTMEHMALHDIASGAGVALLDPHGDLIYDMLHLIPKDCLDRTIHLCWNDPDWVPLWNPLHTLPNQDLARTADEIVSAIKSIVQGWGDRLENLLRHAIYALLHLKGSTLQDVSNILRKKSDESQELIAKILKLVDNETARQFWKYDFNKYNNQDLSPPQHKLSKLLLSGTVSLMLSQPESRVNFREIMDTGKILLVNLSGFGVEAGALLGSFILSLLRVTAVGRSDIPYEQRKDFHIYCDEAHKFLTTSLEDIIPEARKFKVSMTLAHQYMSQFSPEKRDSVLTTGTTMVFNVDLHDAAYLAKDFQGKVKPEDFAGFDVGDAIARIGTSVVRIKTEGRLEYLKDNPMQTIIDESHRKYYRPATEVKSLISHRIAGGTRSYASNQRRNFSEVQEQESKYYEWVKE